MAQFTLKKSETIRAITIDILDEQENVQLNIGSNGMLNLTWVWDGSKDIAVEKKRLLEDLQTDLSYIRDNLGNEVADQVVDEIFMKIDTAYICMGYCQEQAD